MESQLFVRSWSALDKIQLNFIEVVFAQGIRRLFLSIAIHKVQVQECKSPRKGAKRTFYEANMGENKGNVSLENV